VDAPLILKAGTPVSYQPFGRPTPSFPSIRTGFLPFRQATLRKASESPE